MCGRYGLLTNGNDISREFNADRPDFEIKENYNAAPTQEMPVIERHSPNSLHVRFWGFQPHWSPKVLINAQAEKLSVSSVWKKAFLESRCIVPADYFFEWKRLTDGKQPYLIRLKNKKMMGFAGLTLISKDKSEKEQIGFVIITTTPNSLMKQIHNRMPAILRKEDEDEWLNPDNSEPEKLEKMLMPISASEMETYPVSSIVNSPKNNSPEITNPLK